MQAENARKSYFFATNGSLCIFYDDRPRKTQQKSHFFGGNESAYCTMKRVLLLLGK